MENRMASNESAHAPRARRRTWFVRIAILAVGIALGAVLFGRVGSDSEDSGIREVATSNQGSIWTCSMHPQIRLPNPGKCPICFMDLIPLEEDEGGGSPIQMSMSEEAMKMAEVQTVSVRRGFTETEVRTVGKVQPDERKLRKVSAWVGGRLDRLYVDYTGVPVRAGDHLVEIYSPELYSAQAELIESLKARRELDESRSAFIRETAEATVTAAREKLRLLGLKEEQIAAIEARGIPTDHLTIYSPVGGIVVHKDAVEGDYVKTGSPIYTIAELSSVWVLLDVYESDLVWVHYGQAVQFEVEAFPGEVFEGRIAFIDPLVNPATRTVKVRVNVANPDLRLKPDMFVRAVIRARVLGDGRMLAPDMAGKWISPMHPEIIKDHPGTCDICGMALVPAEKLGFVTRVEMAQAPLVIPATAPLITGKRAVVYVRVPGTEKPTFEGREVVLGPRAGDAYIVEAGLTEGEEDVVKGNFKIDSAMQIQAKPSMMSPEGGPPAPGHDHGGARAAAAHNHGQDPEHEAADTGRATDSSRLFASAAARLRPQLPAVYGAYLELQKALAGDDLRGAKNSVQSLSSAVRDLDRTDLSDEEHAAWTRWSDHVVGGSGKAIAATDLAGVRAVLPDLTARVLELERTAGPPEGEIHRLIFCPMAFDNKGAHWVQREKTVLNPYFGKSMLRCGTVRDSFEAAPR